MFLPLSLIILGSIHSNIKAYNRKLGSYSCMQIRFIVLLDIGKTYMDSVVLNKDQ